MTLLLIIVKAYQLGSDGDDWELRWTCFKTSGESSNVGKGVRICHTHTQTGIIMKCEEGVGG